MSIRHPICTLPWNPSRVYLITNQFIFLNLLAITISARMLKLNKYGKRTQPCRTPFLTRNHSDSVPATLILASCFLYSLTSKSIKCRGYPSQVGVLLRRLNLGLRKQRHTMARDSSFLTSKMSAKFKRNHPQRGRQIEVGSVQIGDFRPICRYNSETVQDRDMITMEG